MVKYVLSLCVLFIIGCTSLHGMSRLAQFDDISYAYGQAIRWGDYEMANGFIKKQETDHESWNVDKLDKIRVTSYELLNSNSSVEETGVGPSQLADTAKETVIICANHALKTVFLGLKMPF